MFNIYTYFDDNKYLIYLIGETIKYWSEVSELVYNGTP